MVISLLNIRITLQQNTIVVDEIGNRKNEWVSTHVTPLAAGKTVV